MGNEDNSPKVARQALVVLLTLLVFGGGIWLAKEQMGQRIREQVLARHAQELYAISLVHQITMAESGEFLFLEDVASQLTVYGAIAELSGALGIRLHTSDGEFLVAYPENISDGQLRAVELEQAKLLVASGGMNEAAQAKDVFWEPLLEGETADTPLAVREVVLPVHVADEEVLLGVVQFLFDGYDAMADIAELDAGLFRQGLFIFAVGGGVISLLLALSFIRLNRIHRSLARRTFALKRANQELALSNRTSAVGGVASHLIHGLRNPLAGLRAYLDDDTPATGDLPAAKAAAKRMEGMIDNIVRTLGENASDATYELSVEELLEIFRSRIEPVAIEQGVRLEVNGAGGRELDNREGNLVLLILENLAQNAIEATGRGGQVGVHATGADGVTAFEVSDNGQGLPEAVRESLFQPGNTSKEQGSGLGLAISGQLAGAVDADLALVKSDENGTTFRLTLAKRESA